MMISYCVKVLVLTNFRNLGLEESLMYVCGTGLLQTSCPGNVVQALKAVKQFWQW